MAFSSTIFILFSLATASTIAHANVALPPIFPPTLAQVNVVGRLVCTVDGNPVAGIFDPPVAGAIVTLSCNGGQTTLGQAVTNTAGFYQVVLNTLDGVVFHESDCATFIQLPLANCNLLPPTGILTAPVNFLNIVPGVLGLVGWVIAGAFELVAGA